MPARYQDNAWTVVVNRGGRRREHTRMEARYRPDSSRRSSHPSRRSSYPARSVRRSYASVTRGNRLPEGVNFQRPPQDRWYRGPQRFTQRNTHYGGRPRPKRSDGRRTNQRYVDRIHGEGARSQSQRVQTDDPDFLMKVTTIHRLIKTVHHLFHRWNILPPLTK